MDNLRTALNIPYDEIQSLIEDYNVIKVFIRQDINFSEVPREGQDLIAVVKGYRIYKDRERSEVLAFRRIWPYTEITRYNSLFVSIISPDKWEYEKKNDNGSKSTVLEADDNETYKVLVIEHSTNILRILIRSDRITEAFNKLKGDIDVEVARRFVGA